LLCLCATLAALLVVALPASATVHRPASRHSNSCGRRRVVRGHQRVRHVVLCRAHIALASARQSHRHATAHTATAHTATIRTATAKPVAKAATAWQSGLVVGLNANVSGWGGDGTSPRMQQVVSQTGARWLREEFWWQRLEPSRGSFDFSYYDHFMQVAAQQGERVMPVVDVTPAWAGATDNTIPADPSTYAGVIAAIAKRYGPGGTFWSQNPGLPAGSAITTVELWNEPYYDNGDNGDYDPGRYANLVKAAVTAGRAANRGVHYLLAAETTGRQVGSSWINWIDALYQAMPDLNSYFDGVAIHPYGHDTTGLTGMGDRQLRRTELIHQLFAEHGADDKPLWVTEVGWPTCTSGSDRCTTDAGQAASLSQLVAYLHGSWAPYVKAVFLYHYEDLGSDPGNSENFYGLTTATHQAKPVLAIFKALAATSA
jgi:hypothetical protein